MAFTQWLPASRRGGGEYTIPSITVPFGVDEVRLQLDVAPADFSTPDLSVTASIQISTDGGNTWNTEMSIFWEGRDPPPTRPGVTPGWYASVSDIGRWAGMLARVHFTTVGRFRWGLLGEIR